MQTDDIKKEQLIALSQGDLNAFDILFLKYFPKIKNFLAGFLENKTDAEDLAQDIFVKIWQSRSLLANVENINAYLYRTAKNTLYNYLELSLTKKFSIDDYPVDFATKETLEEIIFAKELEDLINLTVEKMPPQRKKIYQMSRIEGMNNEEIALQLSLSKRTIEAHISTALADIRKILSLFLLFF